MVRASPFVRLIGVAIDNAILARCLATGTGKVDPREVFNGVEGFDVRFSRKGLFGTGTYFAVDAAYSTRKQYAFSKGDSTYQVILATVLTGNAYMMRPSYQRVAWPNKPPRCPFEHEASPEEYNADAAGEPGREPEPEPELEPEPESTGLKVQGVRFDSITGTTQGSQVFIVHGNGRAYPTHCVTFIMQ
jgi:hypothetical protein